MTSTPLGGRWPDSESVPAPVELNFFAAATFVIVITCALRRCDRHQAGAPCPHPPNYTPAAKVQARMLKLKIFNLVTVRHLRRHVRITHSIVNATVCSEDACSACCNPRASHHSLTLALEMDRDSDFKPYFIRLIRERLGTLADADPFGNHEASLEPLLQLWQREGSIALMCKHCDCNLYACCYWAHAH